MKMMPSLALAASFCFCPSGWALTVSELAAKNLEARGGAAALSAVQGVKRSGKFIIGEGRFVAGYVEMRARPKAIRGEFSLQGLVNVQAYDGKEGWQIDPFQGRKDPERMPEDSVKGLIEDSDIDGPLVDSQKKGYTVDYLGTEDIDGTPAHKLKVVKANGDLQYLWLDPDHFLEIRTESQRSVRGVKEITVTEYGDYEKAGGIYWPMSIAFWQKGSSDRQVIDYQTVEINPPLPASLFAFPVAVAK